MYGIKISTTITNKQTETLKAINITLPLWLEQEPC